jgi:hypothetical protein
MPLEIGTAETISFPSIAHIYQWIGNGEFAWMGAFARIIPLLLVLSLLDVILKAIALRKAGNQKQLAWFVCLFIFNTCGILPLIYLIGFQQKKKQVN